MLIGDAGSCAHALDITHIDDRAVAQFIFMLQRAVQHVGDNLPVFVGVCANITARRNLVIIANSFQRRLKDATHRDV